MQILMLLIYQLTKIDCSCMMIIKIVNKVKYEEKKEKSRLYYCKNNLEYSLMIPKVNS